MGGLEGVQQGAAEMAEGSGNGPGGDAGTAQPKKERVQRDLPAWEGVKTETGSSRRHPVTGQEAQAEVQKTPLKIKQNLFTVRMVERWNGSPREVGVSAWEMFRPN